MKLFAKSLILTTGVALLSGCGYFKTPSIIQGRDKQYLAAHSIPPLRVPQGLSSSAFKNEYPIPPNNYPNADKSVNITPPGIKSN